MAKEELGYIDISGVVDLDKVIIKPNMVMVEVVSNVKSDIIIPDAIRSEMSDNYVIYKLGANVVGYCIGDIVFDMNMAGAGLYKHSDTLYIVIDQYNLKMVTSGDNYKKVE
jgi:hypothetical protein